jgi:hypothetical protein
VKVVMLVKVRKRWAAQGAFAASCVVWVKDEHGNILCDAAHYFGSRPIDEIDRNDV